MTLTSRSATGILLALVLAAEGLYIAAFNPARFGMYHDDGIYAVTAKALATGRGYRIISLPSEPAQTKYPPVYPFLLSLIWRVYPSFPENLPALLALSLVMAGLLLIFSYGYLVRRGYVARWMGLVLVAMMVFNWRIVLLSGSLYSELVYTVLSLGTLWLAERYLEKGRLWLGVMAGLCLGLTFLTRTIGVSLIGAVAVYYLLRGRPRRLWTLAVVSTLLIVPWLLWQHAHRSPNSTPAMAYYTDYLADLRLTVRQPAGILKVLWTNLYYLTLIFMPAVSLSLDATPSKNLLVLLISLLAFALIAIGALRQWLSRPRLPDVYVAFYFGVLLVWPYTSFDRFLLPLLPFLLMYLLDQLGRFVPKRSPDAAARPSRGPADVIGWTLVVALGALAVYGGVTGVRAMLTGQAVYREYARRERSVLEWIRANTLPGDVILAYRDPTVYLYTGRHAARSLLLHGREIYSGSSFDPSEARILLDLVRQNRANYLVLMRGDFDLEVSPNLIFEAVEKIIADYPGLFRLVYGTPRSFARIYHIEPGL